MKRRLFACLILASGFLLPPGAHAQSPEQQIVNDAAAALGGRDRVLAVKTLVIEGAGHDMSVGQALRYDELGLLSDITQIRDYKRAYDLANGRARFEATRHVQIFYVGDAPARQVQHLDKDVAFNVAGNGNATRVFAPGQIANRRFEYLRHPLTILRAALDPASTLANGRTQGNERLVDVTSGRATLTLAIDGSTRLPTRVVVMTDSATLGDTAVETQFKDYRDASGLQLPTRFTTKTDRFVSSDIRIFKQTVDGDVGNLAAPASVASATAPANAGQQEKPATKAEEIAKGVWFVTGTTHHSLLVEFSDHLMLIEAPNDERTLAARRPRSCDRPSR